MREPLTYKLGGPYMFQAEFDFLNAEIDRLNAEIAALRVVADRDALQVIAQYERAQQAEAEVARIVRERDALEVKS